MKKYVDPKTVVLKDLVQPGKKVHFSFYRDKEFWYEHDDGFTFPIALDEVEGPKPEQLCSPKIKQFTSCGG